MRTAVFALTAALVSFSGRGAFSPEREVMSKAYWDIWNDDACRKIDADIEKYRKDWHDRRTTKLEKK